MRLISFDVTLKFGNDVPFDVNMSPQEAFALLNMPSMCDVVCKLIPQFAPDEGDEFELPSMPKEDN